MRVAKTTKVNYAAEDNPLTCCCQALKASLDEPFVEKMECF